MPRKRLFWFCSIFLFIAYWAHGQAPRPWQRWPLPLPAGSQLNDFVFKNDSAFVATTTGVYLGRLAAPAQLRLWDTAGLNPGSLNIGAVCLDSAGGIWAAIGDSARRRPNSYFRYQAGRWRREFGIDLVPEPTVGLATAPDGAVLRAAGRWGPVNLAFGRFSGGLWQETFSLGAFNRGVNRVVVDRRGRIWALGTAPTFVGNGTPGTFQPYRYDATIYDGASDPTSTADSLYAATARGLAKFLGTNGRYTRQDSASGLPLPGSRLRSLHFMPDGTLLVGTERHGLLVRRGSRWWLWGQPYLPTGGGPAAINRIVAARTRQPYLLTPQGIYAIPRVLARINPPASPPCPNQAWVPENHSLGLIDTALSYRWSFGDNTPEVLGRAPAHTYARSGTFAVRLIATNARGQADTAFLQLNVGGGGTLRLVSDNSPFIRPDSGALFIRVQGQGLPGSYTWFRNGGIVATRSVATPLLADSAGAYWLVNQGASCALRSDTFRVQLRPAQRYGEGVWAAQGPLLVARYGQPLYVADEAGDPPPAQAYATTSIGTEAAYYTAHDRGLFYGEDSVRGYFRPGQRNALGLLQGQALLSSANLRSQLFLLQDSADRPVCLYGTPGKRKWFEGEARLPWLSRISLPGPAVGTRALSAGPQALAPYRQTTAENSSLAAILHRNGQDVWLLTRHDSGGTAWMQINLHRQADGRVLYLGRQALGPWTDTARLAVQRLFFRASQDGRRLVIRTGLQLRVYAFDNLQGQATLLQTIGLPSPPFLFGEVDAADFSPNRRYLYTLETDTTFGGADRRRLYRYDLRRPQAELFARRKQLRKGIMHDLVAWPGAGIVVSTVIAPILRDGTQSGIGLYSLGNPNDSLLRADSLFVAPFCQAQGGLALPNLVGTPNPTPSADVSVAINSRPLFGAGYPLMLYTLTGPIPAAPALGWQFGTNADTIVWQSGRQIVAKYRQAGTYNVGATSGTWMQASRAIRVFGEPRPLPTPLICPQQGYLLPYRDSLPLAYRRSHNLAGQYQPFDSTLVVIPFGADTLRRPGVYFFIASVGCSYRRQDSVVVRRRPAVVLTATADAPTACPGDTVSLKATSTDTGIIRWTGPNGEALGQGAAVLGIGPGQFSISQAATCGPAQATVTVLPKADCTPPTIMPDRQNIVTPNGDGLNDYLAPRGWQTATLQLYTRWGSNVAVPKTPAGYDLSGLPQGTYFYTLGEAGQPSRKSWVEVVQQP